MTSVDNHKKLEGGKKFVLESSFKPSGDQPRAITELLTGLNSSDRSQVLLGATGTGGGNIGTGSVPQSGENEFAGPQNK